MSSLNLSTNGPSINRSYQSVLNAPLPTGPASSSPTYGTWALFSVSAPLANAFAQTSSSGESVLKVQATGEGELVDLIDEFSDGKIQFAFAKVKDPNTTLFKSVLIAWCGEGVPERTKGYFTSHLTTVAKTLHGYHVQVTARSDRDLTPESIVQKVSDASGSKYSGATSVSAIPPPPVASKPVFTPTQSNAGSSGFNPLAARAQQSGTAGKVDQDGWGEDAPPVTRTQLEKVQPSYQPTKVGLHGLASRNSADSAPAPSLQHTTSEESNVVRGAYQPVGKVDIAEIRRQAQRNSKDDRPVPVKGAYEPVGKVDIAAIRARAQQPSVGATPEISDQPEPTNREEPHRSIPDRTQPLDTSERITSLPKPKIANRFGSSTSSFTGTKPPAPVGVGLDSKASSANVKSGVGRTFADQGGKTPAQIWAEKKAGAGSGNVSDGTPAPAIISQTSGGGGEWKSGYAGKSWAPVQTTRTERSSSNVGESSTEPNVRQQTGEPEIPAGGVDAIKDRFKTAAPAGGNSTFNAPTPPALDISNKPNATRSAPGLGGPTIASQATTNQNETPTIPSPPPQPPRSPTPPTPPAVSGSPIQVAMPVGRHQQSPTVTDAREELASPPPMPTRSLANAIPQQEELADEQSAHQAARGAAEATAVSSFGASAVETAQSGATETGQRAIVSYDYEKAEDNELELREGETVFNIEMVDENWWMGQNEKGEAGLFPSNYVELAADAEEAPNRQEPEATPSAREAAPAAQSVSYGKTATALYDYEAAEDNELSFPEDAKITDVEFPDEDWWSGSYRGKEGLFPANYVKLDT